MCKFFICIVGLNMCRCAFNGIFNVEYWRNLEMYVRGHSRSLEMAPFDRSHTISYLSFIVNDEMCLYFVLCCCMVTNIHERPKKTTPVRGK